MDVSAKNESVRYMGLSLRLPRRSASSDRTALP